MRIVKREQKSKSSQLINFATSNHDITSSLKRNSNGDTFVLLYRRSATFDNNNRPVAESWGAASLCRQQDILPDADGGILGGLIDRLAVRAGGPNHLLPQSLQNLNNQQRELRLVLAVPAQAHIPENWYITALPVTDKDWIPQGILYDGPADRVGHYTTDTFLWYPFEDFKRALRRVPWNQRPVLPNTSFKLWQHMSVRYRVNDLDTSVNNTFLAMEHPPIPPADVAPVEDLVAALHNAFLAVDHTPLPVPLSPVASSPSTVDLTITEAVQEVQDTQVDALAEDLTAINLNL